MIVVLGSTRYDVANPTWEKYRIDHLVPKIRFDAEKGYFHQRAASPSMRARISCTWDILTSAEYSAIRSMLAAIGGDACHVVPIDVAQSGSSYAYECHVTGDEYPTALITPDGASGYVYSLTIIFESVGPLTAYTIPSS
jgi:hypothetical protein